LSQLGNLNLQNAINQQDIAIKFYK